MVESEQRLPRSRAPSRTSSLASEDLPYRIELCDRETGSAERVLARAQNGTLARAIFEAACAEYLGRDLVLKRGTRVVAKRRT